MWRSTIAVAGFALLAGCGDGKLKEAEHDVTAIGRLATSRPGESNLREAQRFYTDRETRGDTVPIPAAELLPYLPESIPGFMPEGPASVAGDTTTDHPITLVTRSWRTADSAAAGPRHLTITISDLGGSSGIAPRIEPLISEKVVTETAARRIRVIRFDVPYTSGIEDLDKDEKRLKVIAGTRYRYVITVETAVDSDDEIPMLTRIAAGIARRFRGK